MKDLVGEVYRTSTRRALLGAAGGKLSSAHGSEVPANLAAVEASEPEQVQNTCGGVYARFGKRAFDIFLVVLSLPVTLPLIAVCGLALRIEGGNPFYRQDRLGRNGQRFSIVKLRTMVMDAEKQFEMLMETNPGFRKEWETTQKIKDDPRITQVGSILRRTSLDELPQIWNILRGEMSIVGPRPMLPEQLPLYGPPEDYFAMRPGLTGSWQVSCRNQDSFSLRAKFDKTYAASVSLFGDVGLIYRTIGVVLRRTGY